MQKGVTRALNPVNRFNIFVNCGYLFIFLHWSISKSISDESCVNYLYGIKSHTQRARIKQVNNKGLIVKLIGLKMRVK